MLIPSAWIEAAIDAHKKLFIEPSGEFLGALDIADQGIDKCAFAGGQGILLQVCEEWSGKGSDTFKSTQRAFELADEWSMGDWLYDADGMGASVRGDARVINEQRIAEKRRAHNIHPFRGSGEVLRPEAEDEKNRKNKDFFLNRKAQAWWSLRRRFRATYRWIVEGQVCGKDEVISLDSRLPNLQKLRMELSQPTYDTNGVGKLLIVKAPDGTKSPNMADAVMMRYSGARRAMRISDDDLRDI